MPKIIDIALIDVLCVNPGPNDSVEIGGVVFGATFKNDPNNPSDETSRQEIFRFPDSFILHKGEQKPITSIENFPSESFSFDLSTPSLEDPNLFPKFLRIRADLNGLGTQVRDIKFDDGIVDVPLEIRHFQLAFTNESLLISLEFVLREQEPFSG